MLDELLRVELRVFLDDEDEFCFILERRQVILDKLPKFREGHDVTKTILALLLGRAPDMEFQCAFGTFVGLVEHIDCAVDVDA